LASCHNEDEHKQAVLKALHKWQSRAFEKLQASRCKKSHTLPTSPAAVLVLPGSAGVGSLSTAQGQAGVKQQDDIKASESSSSMLNLEIKVLGWNHRKELADKRFVESCGSYDGNFAANVQVVVGHTNNEDSSTLLSRTKVPFFLLFLSGVSPQHTCADLFEFLHKTLVSVNTAKATTTTTPRLRLIHGGRNIAALSSNIYSRALGSLFAASPKKRQEAAASAVQLICLVSSSCGTSNDSLANPRSDIQARIAAIRNAARHIQDTSKLEITDQRGSIIPMTKDDRMGFLTALALHRMGMNLLNHENNNNNDPDSSTSKEDALILLLEADFEWTSHPNLMDGWKHRVDNYGLLQLDIVWMYLQLESLENLPDSLRRLKEAEEVLRKQVHVNFVALALTQAEMGNVREVRNRNNSIALWCTRH
jgi:hypothetical protein